MEAVYMALLMVSCWRLRCRMLATWHLGCEVGRLPCSRHGSVRCNVRREPVFKVGIPKTITVPKTTTMYQIHTNGSNKCMHVVHSGGFRFGDGFRYSYLSVMAACWFCEKSGWIGRVEDVKLVLLKKKTDFNRQPFWGGNFYSNELWNRRNSSGLIHIGPDIVRF